MVSMNLPDGMRRFVDDELLRAPLVVGTVIDAALGDMRSGASLLPPRERGIAHEIQQRALSRRAQAVQQFVQSLREQVHAELGRSVLMAPGQAALATPAASLSLLDDATVTADVEMSHLIEAVKTQAEHELRELAAYTSSLMGDMDVARDHNLFRPETYVRALWAAAQEMPAALDFQVAFMRHARHPLAQVLRKAYAGASARLESGGVPAAVYRTVIVPPGSRTPRPSESWQGIGPDLHLIRDSLALPLRAAEVAAPTPRTAFEPALAASDRALQDLPADAKVGQITTLIDTLRMRLADHAPGPAERQTVELVCRLFEAIVGERRLAPELSLGFATLLVPAIRLALHEPAALDDYVHPLWRFIDRTAFLVDLMSDARADHRAGLHLEVRMLLRQLVREPRQESDLYRRALLRLGDWELHRLEQDCHRSAAQLTPLETLERRLLAAQAPAQTVSGALDVGHLDTVPAVLLEALPQTRNASEDEAASWVARRAPGDWLRIFVQGRWQRARLLWQSPLGEISLLGDLAGNGTWAVRQRALNKLYAENLLSQLQPQSLVGVAAGRVQRTLGDRRAA